MNSTARQLILASSSPRRRDLLAAAGYRFRVMEPRESAECGICTRETPGEMVSRLAFQKAQDVAQRIVDGTLDPGDARRLVACDTVAECRGQILGKPRDREHAREMLTLLRATVHHVHSGLCVWRLDDHARLVKVASSRLRMDDVTDAEIEAYLDSDQWEGKAGAFGYQDGIDWLHLEQGAASNVVGLPMDLLAEMLAELERR